MIKRKSENIIKSYEHCTLFRIDHCSFVNQNFEK